jgi:hypothetical protein
MRTTGISGWQRRKGGGRFDHLGRRVIESPVARCALELDGEAPISRRHQYLRSGLRCEGEIANCWEKNRSLAKLEADGTVKMIFNKYGVDDWEPLK